jgi:predicted house-cleaning noncanonical NTP pyrophosphatase (MazG superfamily)
VEAMTQYNKLVRDTVPEILRAKGRKIITRTIAGPEMLDALRAKIDEEVAEYDAATDDIQAAAELADLLEVILTLARKRGFDEADMQRIRAEKAELRGGFDRGCFLVETE